MGIMIDSVGKKILNANESEEYKNVLVKQKIFSFCDALVKGIDLDEEDRCNEKSERIRYIQHLLDVLYMSIDTEIWDAFRSDEEDEYMQFYHYFWEKDICLSDCVIDLDEILIENKQFYENEFFREILINQLAENESYNILFEEE